MNTKLTYISLTTLSCLFVLSLSITPPTGGGECAISFMVRPLPDHCCFSTKSSDSEFCGCPISHEFDSFKNSCCRKPCFPGQNWRNEADQNQCESQCASNQYFDYKTNQCACSKGYYLDTTINLCVIKPTTQQTTSTPASGLAAADSQPYHPSCPSDHMYNSKTGSCVLPCPAGQGWNSTEGKCFDRCPSDQQGWNEELGRCVNCPWPYFLSEADSACCVKIDCGANGCRTGANCLCPPNHVFNQDKQACCSAPQTCDQRKPFDYGTGTCGGDICLFYNEKGICAECKNSSSVIVEGKCSRFSINSSRRNKVFAFWMMAFISIALLL